jgi:hypothetical protein
MIENAEFYSKINRNATPSMPRKKFTTYKGWALGPTVTQTQTGRQPCTELTGELHEGFRSQKLGKISLCIADLALLLARVMEEPIFYNEPSIAKGESDKLLVVAKQIS